MAAVGAKSSGPWGVLVTGLVSDKRENVGTNIPTTESVQVPICLDSADLRVVVVELRVSGANELLGNSVTKKDAEDAVLEGVGVRFIKGHEKKGVLHEVLVVEKRLQEVASPGASSGNTSIVAV